MDAARASPLKRKEQPTVAQEVVPPSSPEQDEGAEKWGNWMSEAWRRAGHDQPGSETQTRDTGDEKWGNWMSEAWRRVVRA